MLQGIAGFLKCALWTSNFTYNMTSLVSTYILAAFTIEVYMAIVHPVKHKHIFSHRLVALMVAGAWVISIGFLLSVPLGIAKVINGACFPAYGWPSLALPLGIVSFLLRMVMPILCYGLCYALTFASLKTRAKIACQTVAMSTTNQKQGPQLLASQISSVAATANHKQYSRASQNVAITVFYTIVFHVLAWTGNQVQILVIIFGYPIDPSSLLYQILLLATYCTSCINPFIYVIKYKKFRHVVGLSCSAR